MSLNHVSFMFTNLISNIFGGNKPSPSILFFVRIVGNAVCLSMFLSENDTYMFNLQKEILVFLYIEKMLSINMSESLFDY